MWYKYATIELQQLKTRRQLIFIIAIIILINFIVYLLINSRKGSFEQPGYTIFNLINSSGYSFTIGVLALYEIAFSYTKGIYRRLLTDGFSRQELFLRQAFMIGSYSIIILAIAYFSIIAHFILNGFTLQEVLTLQHFPSWLNQALLLWFTGAFALALGNLFRGYYNLLILFFWDNLEHGLNYLTDKLFNKSILMYLPNALSKAIVGDTFLSTQQVLLLGFYFLLFLLISAFTVNKRTI